MNREIIFRGKRVDNGEWVYSMTISEGTIKRKRGKFYMELSEGVWKQVIPETVSQFTGLLDKNGNRIFEGDMYTIPNFTGKFIVRFENGSFIGGNEHEGTPLGWCVNFDSYSGEYTELITKDDFTSVIEITGNIHDNEL